MNEYEGDFRCEVSEGERCHKEATQCWRELFTPSNTPVIACDEHSDALKAQGYHFDNQATVMLARDREREARLQGELQLAAVQMQAHNQHHE